MGGAELVSVLAFVSVTGLAAAAIYFLKRDQFRAGARVRELSGAPPRTPPTAWLRDMTLTRLPALAGPQASGGAEAAGLAERLRHAGLYDAGAASAFAAARLLAVGLGSLAALAVAFSGAVPAAYRPAAVVLALGAAVLAPGLWLDARRRARQNALRRGLPDALDMLVLCLEGGLSLNGAFQRVTAEVQAAHPVLGHELTIAEREMLLGQTAGEAVQRLARRTGLEEARGLAAILLQAERYGVSVGKALRNHADTLRQQRRQRAEEQAQKAAVKILFPTLLCIFPAIFIVILGPAALQIMTTLARTR
jgi:tight adherence protein C